jgi:Ca2+-binding EF-hand superfamily protein
MMQRLDTNSDGSISQEEAAAEERVKNSFSEYDSNKDGKVDRAELTTVLRKRMAAMSGGAGGPPGGAGGPGPRAN